MTDYEFMNRKIYELPKIKNKKLGLKIVFKANEYILSSLNEKVKLLKIKEMK